MSLENNKCAYKNHTHMPANKHKHNHDHHDHHEHDEHTHDFRSLDKKVLKIGFFITLFAMVVEIIAGVLSNSLALISDAIHMFTHTFALGLSLVAIIVATTKRSKNKTFGYYRFEVIAAFINGITIAISVVWILYEAIHRLLNPGSIDIKMMLIFATFGLIVNIITGVILFKGDRENINVKSAFFHMLADAASSVAIIIGGVIIYFTNFYIIDTILALIVATLIGRWSYTLLKESTNILLESSPLDIDEVKMYIEKNSNFIEAHDLHIVQITHNMNTLSAHVVMDKSRYFDFEQIVEELNHKLLDKYNITHTVFQPEYR